MKIDKNKLTESYEKFKPKTNIGNERDYQWDILQKQVAKAIKSYRINNKLTIEVRNNLSIHLGMFLASWGMMRGSSLLLQKFNYKVHDGLIDKIFKDDKYFVLFNIKTLNKIEENKDLIVELFVLVSEYYAKEYNTVSDKEYTLENISKTLVSKVMVGLFGCIIAYDYFAVKSLSTLNKTYGDKHPLSVNSEKNFIKSINGLINLMKEMDWTKSKDNSYSIMKELDMALFQWGLDNDK